MAYWHPEAEKELKETEKRVKKHIRKYVKKFEREGTDYKHVGLIERQYMDFQMWRIKVMPEKHPEINYRVFFDEYYDKYVIYGVKHREDAYKIQTLEEILKREY